MIVGRWAKKYQMIFLINTQAYNCNFLAVVLVDNLSETN